MYTDFNKTFDVIDRNILLRKLSTYGLRLSLLSLLQSYLTKRTNYVFYNRYKSPEYCSLSGVLRGSHLGPLLFVLFNNDLLDSLPCPVLACVDNLKIYLSVKTNNGTLHLQENLDNITQWCLSHTWLSVSVHLFALPEAVMLLILCMRLMAIL